jgi:energy-coupling factor transport system permease protein
MTQSPSLYAPRQSGLHRLNPLTKLTLAGFLLVAGLAVPGTWSTYALLAVPVVPVALWGRILRPLASAAWRICLPFAVSVFLIQGLFWHGGTPVLALGPISFKQEGLVFALASTGRILLVVSSFLLLFLSTRPDGLMISLSQRGLPSSLTYIVLATMQIIPRFQARAATILAAQQSRGLEIAGSLRQRASALIPLVGPLVLGSIVDVEQRAIALEARGFSRSGPKTSLVTVEDSPAQAVTRVLLVLGATAAAGWRAFVIFFT